MQAHFSTQFVGVASIAAQLSAVLAVAKEISLAAANAKAIAFRAGEKARGFQPITDFINDLAKETMVKVHAINHNALDLYQLTVSDHRAHFAYQKLCQAEQLARSTPHHQSLLSARLQAEQRAKACEAQFQRYVVRLLDQLQEVKNPARAARVIAANSRIEASQAGEYLQSLQAVAESVDKAAQVIHDNVQRCCTALSAMYKEQAEAGVIL
ncbi:MAG: chemotaxis protein [Methylococcales bacterium]|nr:chemotaxis protein [Methylococcales bacterium]